jgi:hypothetical protein
MQSNFLPWLDEIFLRMEESTEPLSVPSRQTVLGLAASSHGADFEADRANRLKIELLKAIGDLMRAAQTCDRLKGELAALRLRKDAPAVSPPIAGRAHFETRRKPSTCSLAPLTQKLLVHSATRQGAASGGLPLSVPIELGAPVDRAMIASAR